MLSSFRATTRNPGESTKSLLKERNKGMSDLMRPRGLSSLARMTGNIQNSLPVCTDVIHIFSNLSFEIIDRTKYSIRSDSIHELDMEYLSVNISVKIENMDFKDSARVIRQFMLRHGIQVISFRFV